MFGTRENQGPVVAVPVQQFDQEILLPVLGDKMHRMGDLICDLARRRHLDADRFVQILAGQLCYRLRHRGREHHGLAVAAQQLRDAAQRMDEAHVEHLVGLVENEEMCLAQVDGPAIRQVYQPTRRGHKDVGAAGQFLGLRVDRLAAERRG